MITCKKCGAENPDGYLYCEHCGSKLEEPAVDMSAVKNTVSEAAGKALDGAKNVWGQINTAVENQKEKTQAEAQQEIDRAQKSSGSRNHMDTSSGTKYMSSNEMWSWLQKDNKRQHFYTEEVNTMTAAEYMEKLNGKLQENNVPASVSVRDVQWDRSDVRQRVCCIQPKSNAVNPLSCLVQFNHVGKFTFVEEKTFITPPDLPEVERKVKVDQDLVKRAAWMVWGIIAFLVGMLWLMSTGYYDSKVPPVVVMFAGVGMVYVGYTAREKLKKLNEHNSKCEKQEKAWEKAWDNWENSIFLHSFQESTNGQISRIYDAAFECIKQLNEELFAKQASEEQQESQSMNELEQMIARRRDDYR